MAGNYPDAPSWRMAYDRDGSIGFAISTSGVVSQATEANLVAANDEAAGEWLVTGGSTGTTVYAGVIFPELRDVDAVYVGLAALSNGVVALQTSVDTTNGLDGTWVALAENIPAADLYDATAVPSYRQEISSGTALGVRGFRVKLAAGTAFGTYDLRLRSLHLYGERAPGQAINALELWHPTNDEKLPPAWLDWGNTPRGSSDDRLFRVKNVSTTSTAEDVRVAMDVLTDGSPSVPGQHLLSYGGGSFLAQVNVGDLTPGAISGPVTLRRVLQSNAQLGVFAFRVFAEPDAWA